MPCRCWSAWSTTGTRTRVSGPGAALSRIAKNDFKADKQKWNAWWIADGHPTIDSKLLEPTRHHRLRNRSVRHRLLR